MLIHVIAKPYWYPTWVAVGFISRELTLTAKEPLVLKFTPQPPSKTPIQYLVSGEWSLVQNAAGKTNSLTLFILLQDYTWVELLGLHFLICTCSPSTHLSTLSSVLWWLVWKCSCQSESINDKGKTTAAVWSQGYGKESSSEWEEKIPKPWWLFCPVLAWGSERQSLSYTWSLPYSWAVTEEFVPKVMCS